MSRSNPRSASAFSGSPAAAQPPRRRFHAAVLASTLAGLVAGSGLGARRAWANPLLSPTPSDLEGPYRPPKGTAWGGTDLRVAGAGPSPGRPLVFAGRLMDTSGQPLPGRQIQVWQANATGRYDFHPNETPTHGRPDPAFRGHGQTTVDAEGWFAFRTIRPSGYKRTLFGFLPWTFVPHIHVAARASERDLLVTQADLDKVVTKRAAAAQRDHARLMACEAMSRLFPGPGGAAAARVGEADGVELIRFDVVLEAAA